MKISKRQALEYLLTLLVFMAIAFSVKKLLDSGYSIFDSINGKVVIDTEKGMTQKLRKKDFKKICNFLEETVPMLYEYEKLYGIKYEDIKSCYADLIENADSDYEYYAYLNGFFNNIPSGHLSLGFPDISYIPFYFGYETEDNPEFCNALPYWKNVLRDECEKHTVANEDIMTFVYACGEYIGSSGSYENDKYNINNAKLLAVNNLTADEFIKIYPSTYQLKYDHVNKKPCRDILIFNNSFGIECTVTYQSEDGKVYKQDMYCGTVADIAMGYKKMFISDEDAQQEPKNKNDVLDIDLDKVDFMAEEINIGCIMALRNPELNLLFVNIPSFDIDSKYADEIIANSSVGIDNIIIDIRENGGGYEALSRDVLSVLTTDDIEINDRVIITEQNYKRNKRLFNNNKLQNANGVYSIESKSHINGCLAKKKNIYLLISDDTLSAADYLASEFKRNCLGTVIGTNNSQGECRGSPNMKILDNSGLYFYYTEYKYENPDGTDNSVYGTKPDILLEENMDMFQKKQDIILNGENPYSYEGHLQWDEAFIRTLEIIKETEQ